MRPRPSSPETAVPPVPPVDPEHPGDQPDRHGIVMPPLKHMCTSILRQVVEATVVPALLFWSLFHLSGLLWALVAGLAWCYLALARHWVKTRELPGVLIIATVLFTTRTGLALSFHSAFFFLLTPTVNAFVLAAVFVGSALLHRPLTGRIAQDFVHLPAAVVRLVRVQAALRRLCMVWALAQVINGAVALQLLTAHHYDGALLARSILTPVLSAVAVGYCVWLGRKVLRAEGIHLHLRWSDPTPA